MNEILLKKDICEIGRRLWQKDYVAANDGNISVKLSETEFLCTPSGVSKGFMDEEMIIKIDAEGRVIRGPCRKSTSEIKMHLEAYRQRNDIKAVVHSHPPYSLALAISGIPLDACVLPEVVVTLGRVPLARYATPSTEEVPASISNLIKDHDAILLQNHGLLTVGKDLYEAYYKTETVEHFAKIYYLSLATGRINYLDQDEVEKLLQIRKLFGVRENLPLCSMRKEPEIPEDLVRKIVEDVLKNYKK
jgi:L-fuculose-phosphate aldolase